MNTIARRTLLAVAAAALIGITATTAAASPPTKEVFFGDFFNEDTSTCPGLTITQHNVERDTVIEFSSTKLLIERHGVATLTANGKTLTSNFSAQIFFGPTEVKVVGTVYNIQVPGAGSILLDAGNVVVSTDPPTVVHMAGPHQQFSGDVDELCAYLAA
jgi:hypothetical protein